MVREFIPVEEPVEFLSREAETAFIIQAQAGHAARLRLKSGAEITDAERLELKSAMEVGRNAVNELLHSLGPYIRGMAMKWHRKTGNRWTLGDCIQAGNMGAMHSILKFEIERGFKLITYSTMWIWQYLGRMKSFGDVVYRPSHVNDTRKTYSLDKPIGVDGDTTMAALLESGGDDVFRELERREAVDRIAPLLKRLPQRDREIVLLRGTFTLEEIAVQVGLTRERVRQIESRAMRKLKIAAAKMGMKDDVGRERTTVTSRDCVHCGSGDTRPSAKPRRWMCDGCGRNFVPEDMRVPKIEQAPRNKYAARPDNVRVMDPVKPVTPRRMIVEERSTTKIETVPAESVDNCKCGRPLKHRGRCKGYRPEPKTDSASPKKSSTKPSNSTAIVRVPPKSATQVIVVAADLRQTAGELEQEADRLRSKAADLREAARLVDRAASS